MTRRKSPKPFGPRNKFETGLTDPESTVPFHVSITDPKKHAGAIIRTEHLLAVRFGCAVDEYGFPTLNYADDTADLLLDAYKQKVQTVGELHIDVDELTYAGARAVFTMPWNIVGHRNKAVVSAYDYMPTTIRGEFDGQQTLALGRLQVGNARLSAPNPYAPGIMPTDPTKINDRGLYTHVHNRTIGTIV